MPVPRIDELETASHERTSRGGSRLWREWCFARVAVRHFRTRFLIMAGILIGGALLFMLLDDNEHDFIHALHGTWSLVFAQPTEALPRSIILRILFFLIPVLGLTVIIEAIVDFSLMLRDRRRFERSWCTM